MINLINWDAIEVPPSPRRFVVVGAWSSPTNDNPNRRGLNWWDKDGLNGDLGNVHTSYTGEVIENVHPQWIKNFLEAGWVMPEQCGDGLHSNPHKGCTLR